MDKKYIFGIAGIAIALLLFFGIRALVKVQKQNKEIEAWNSYDEAVSLFDKKDYKQALSLCKKIYPNLISNDKKALCLSLEGECVGRDKLLYKAQELFREAIKYKPDDYMVRMRFGRTYHYNASFRDPDSPEAQSEFDQSLNQFNDAFKFCPSWKRKDRQDILFYQADILEKIGNFKMAEDKYKQLIELGENYPDERSEFFDEAVKRLAILERE